MRTGIAYFAKRDWTEVGSLVSSCGDGGDAVTTVQARRGSAELAASLRYVCPARRSIFTTSDNQSYVMLGLRDYRLPDHPVQIPA